MQKPKRSTRSSRTQRRSRGGRWYRRIQDTPLEPRARGAAVRLLLEAPLGCEDPGPQEGDEGEVDGPRGAAAEPAGPEVVAVVVLDEDRRK